MTVNVEDQYCAALLVVGMSRDTTHRFTIKLCVHHIRLFFYCYHDL